MKVFWSCPTLLDFLTFWQNILPLTVGREKTKSKKKKKTELTKKFFKWDICEYD